MKEERILFLITTENKLLVALGFVKLFEILKELLPENKILP